MLTRQCHLQKRHDRHVEQRKAPNRLHLEDQPPTKAVQTCNVGIFFKCDRLDLQLQHGDLTDLGYAHDISHEH